MVALIRAALRDVRSTGAPTRRSLSATWADTLPRITFTALAPAPATPTPTEPPIATAAAAAADTTLMLESEMALNTTPPLISAWA